MDTEIYPEDIAFLTSIGVTVTNDTFGPIVELEDDGFACIKFKSDSGKTDKDQGAAFAKWCMDHSIRHIVHNYRTFSAHVEDLKSAGASTTYLDQVE